MGNLEQWKDIKGYEELYQVSNFGRVKSLNRRVVNGERVMTVKGKFLKVQDDMHGYGVVSLSRFGKVKRCKIHRLVAETFISKEEGKPNVNHIDGNKRNNRVDNLEWVSSSENNQHAWANNLNRNTERQRKAASEWCRKNREKMIAGMKRVKIKCLNNGKIYNSITEASKELGITGSLISRVVKGERSHTHGYKFVECGGRGE